MADNRKINCGCLIRHNFALYAKRVLRKITAAAFKNFSCIRGKGGIMSQLKRSTGPTKLHRYLNSNMQVLLKLDAQCESVTLQNGNFESHRNSRHLYLKVKRRQKMGPISQIPSVTFCRKEQKKNPGMFELSQ